MKEPLPLATIHDAVIDFLRNREDAVLFGAQAANACMDEPPMTRDLGILSTRAPTLAEAIRSYLATKFTIAARVREVAAGRGFRIFQLRHPKIRHLPGRPSRSTFPPFLSATADINRISLTPRRLGLSPQRNEPAGDIIRTMEDLVKGQPALPVSARRARAWTAEWVAVGYMAAVAAAAAITGLATLLFPELGALTHDVLARPWGKWARQPGRLVLTPVLTAVVGTLATRHLPYHVLTILLIVCLSLGIIRLLRSAIAPAISAGVLPLVLGVKSWLYPPGIAAGLICLAAILLAWRRWAPAPSETPRKPDVDDILESAPRGNGWIIALLAFVAIAGLAAQITGWRFILFPPLIVVAYEMFGHPDTCPWAGRPMSLPLACGLTALGGIELVKLFGAGPVSAGLGMVMGIAVLRLFDVHMPPALAVGLIPLVMNQPTWKYPLSVTIGTSALTAASLAYNRLMRTRNIEPAGIG